MKYLRLAATVLLVLLVVATPLYAQSPGDSRWFDVKAAAGIGAGLIIIGAGLGFGKIGAAALESMARQPEAARVVQGAMILIAALLEGATLLALIICILVLVL